MDLNIYKYSGVTPSGKRIRGRIKAVSETQAKSSLPIMSEITSFKNVGKDFNIEVLFKQIKMSKKELAMFLDQIRTLLETGYSQVDTFITLSRHGDKSIRGVAELISEEISEGNSLSEAFKKHSKVLGRDISSQIKASEDSTKISEVLENISVQLEAEQEVNTKIRNALIMPIIMIIMMIMLSLFMILYVIPIMQTLIKDIGAETPEVINVILVWSNFVKENIALTIISSVLLIVAAVILAKGPLSLQWDMLKIRIPVIGKILKMRDVINFYKFLSMSIGAGIPIHVGVGNTLETVTNKAFKKDLIKVRDSITIHAEELNQALRDCSFISEMDRQTILVGERSGTTSEQLMRMAKVKEKALTSSINKLNELLQPVITIIIGGMVAFIGVLMYSTIYSVIGVI